MPKDKSPWLLKLELLKSVSIDSLNSIAETLNSRRLTAVNDRLADTTQIKRTSQTRRKRQGGGEQFERLLKLRESQGWPLYLLPSDLRAEANRMKRCLIALHSCLGNQRCRQISDEEIAEEMCVSVRTASRGIQDCRESGLIQVEEHTRAPVKGGGRSENGYVIIWASITDLAPGPRVQELFEIPLPADTTQQPEPHRHSGQPHCHSGQPHRHSGQPHRHSGQPHRHSGDAYRTARAQSFPISSNPSSSPSRREEEGFVFQNPEWEEAYRSLSQYPVSDADRALRSAARSGWTPEQVCGFVADCEAKSVNGCRAWNAGQVWWQLTKGTPGSRITMQPSEDYRRAKRDQEQAAQKLIATQMAPVESNRDQTDLEALHGKQLDSLSYEEIEALAAEAGVYWLKYFRQSGMSKAVRYGLLQRMHQAESRAEKQT